MSAQDDAALLALLDEFSRECEVGVGADALLAGACFGLYGASFCFRHNKAWPELLTVYCEFGLVPEALQARAWQVLLEANLVLAHAGAMQQSFGLDLDTGAVIAAAHQPAGELDLARLREWLADLAEQVMLWRDDFLLIDDSLQPASAMPPEWLVRHRRH